VQADRILPIPTNIYTSRRFASLLQTHLRVGVHSDDERPRPASAAHPTLLNGGPADACGGGTAFPAPSWAGDCGATAPGAAGIAGAAHAAPASAAGPGDSARSRPRRRVRVSEGRLSSVRPAGGSGSGPVMMSWPLLPVDWLANQS
jgi:hypothetical protein